MLRPVKWIATVMHPHAVGVVGAGALDLESVGDRRLDRNAFGPRDADRALARRVDQVVGQDIAGVDPARLIHPDQMAVGEGELTPVGEGQADEFVRLADDDRLDPSPDRLGAGAEVVDGEDEVAGLDRLDRDGAVGGLDQGAGGDAVAGPADRPPDPLRPIDRRVEELAAGLVEEGDDGEAEQCLLKGEARRESTDEAMDPASGTRRNRTLLLR